MIQNFPKARIGGQLSWATAASVVALLCTSSFAATAPRPRPVSVAGFRGQYCMSMGPRGWAVVAENPQRVSFGADMLSGDGKAAAGYAIFGAGTMAPMPGFDTPDRAVATNLSRLGQIRVQFGQRQQIDRNVFTLPYRTVDTEGLAYYQVIPAQRGGYMVVLRTAYTALGFWQQRGPEASAVARSLRCNVPSMPPAPDPPSLNSKPAPKAGGEEGESDSLYNQWLDKEYFHNPVSGENFWVSPSTDYQQSGPQGPGYYAQHGNDIIKLQSGYSQ
jgi:hypothetical protein